MEAAAIGANGSLGDAESDLPTSEVGLPVPVPTNGDVFALDELLEDFPEPPADVLRQVADPSLELRRSRPRWIDSGRSARSR